MGPVCRHILRKEQGLKDKKMKPIVFGLVVLLPLARAASQSQYSFLKSFLPSCDDQLLDYFNLDLNGEVNEWPSVLKANAEGEVALEKLKVLANYNFMSADSNKDESLSRQTDLGSPPWLLSCSWPGMT